MQEGKITRQDRSATSSGRREARGSRRVSYLPAPLASRARPTRPRQQAHLSARPEPGSLRRRWEERITRSNNPGRRAWDRVGAALSPGPLGQVTWTPPPQGNNSRSELSGLGMTLTGYRSVPGGRDFRLPSPCVGVTSGPASSGAAVHRGCGGGK